jgi:hypothetical protein
VRPDYPICELEGPKRRVCSVGPRSVGLPISAGEWRLVMRSERSDVWEAWFDVARGVVVRERCIAKVSWAIQAFQVGCLVTGAASEG